MAHSLLCSVVLMFEPIVSRWSDGRLGKLVSDYQAGVSLLVVSSFYVVSHFPRRKFRSTSCDIVSVGNKISVPLRGCGVVNFFLTQIFCRFVSMNNLSKNLQPHENNYFDELAKCNGNHPGFWTLKTTLPWEPAYILGLVIRWVTGVLFPGTYQDKSIECTYNPASLRRFV